MNDELRIEWSIGNQCNLNCPYCHWELKDGANSFPTFHKLAPAFDHLIDQCRGFSIIKIEINGGEPSLSDALFHIIATNTDSRLRFKLNSNATAPLDYWKSIAKKISKLVLTYHTTEDFGHFQDVVDIVKEYFEPHILIPFTPENWEKADYVYRTLKSNNSKVNIQFLYQNFTRGNNEYLKYSKEQWDYYYSERGVDPNKKEDVEQTVEFKRTNYLNNYLGHLCWAGVDQIVIDNFGDVWRGWCKSNFKLGNIFDGNLQLDKNPRVCPKLQCRNGFDLQAKKSTNSWGLA